MAIGINEEHQEYRRSLERWRDEQAPPSVLRHALDGEGDELPGFWPSLVATDALAMHNRWLTGGEEGAGLLEWAVATEVLAAGAVPGPWLTTGLVHAVLSAAGNGAGASEAAGGGAMTASLVVPTASNDGPARTPHGLVGRRDGEHLTVTGEVGPVLSGSVVAQLLAPVDIDGVVHWCLLPRGEGIVVSGVESFDLSRPSATWRFEDASVPDRVVLDDVTTELVRSLALLSLSAEAVGGARWCLEEAAGHARTREQFGRPIGQFQGVKHRLANMLVSLEQATAATWDALNAWDQDPDSAPLPIQLAASLALDGYVEAAKGAIQVLGGMGFTWEHDAHVHLRRATTLRQLVGGSAPLRAESARLALAGERRRLSIDLPGEAEEFRARLAPVVAKVATVADPQDQQQALAEEGLLTPHWPAPYGLDAGPVEQLVIDQLLAEAGVRRPNLAVAAWALPTIIAHGTPEQTERWVMPTLNGDVIWCQLFSEPGAGSDLAALSTRATKVDGGWVLNGQKVWTSVAARAHMGIALARTDPDAPKHKGITYFLVDMASEGIEIRPLREITGHALFNEVFFDNCFVPDGNVVGEVNGGWRLARTTLANERVSLSSDSAFGGAIEEVLSRMARDADLRSPVRMDALGGLLAEAQSLAQLGVRSTLRSLGGLEPGSESSVGKLVGGEFDQRVHEFALDLCGPSGVFTTGEAAGPAYGVLQSKCLTIAGGTSEVQRNVIGERMLGLPRDPAPPVKP